MRRVPISAVAIDRGMVGGPFGSSLVSNDYATEGIPVIRGANMSGGRYVGGEFAFVSEAKLQRDLSRNTAQPGDIVFTQRGTLGQVAIVPEGPYDTYVISQSQMRLRVDAGIADARFIFYASTTADFLRQISDRAISTGVPHTNLGILGGLEVPLPPIHDQRAISEVLSALDDKIAANTTLAGSGDSLVRAEYLNLSSSFDPRVRVGDVALSPRDAINPGVTEPSTIYVGLEHMPRRSMWLADQGIAEDVTSSKSRFTYGDVLFGKLRPYFHKVVSAPFSGICSTDVLVVRAKEPSMAMALVAAISSDRVIDSVVSASEGTRMPRTSWKDLAATEISWPIGDHAKPYGARLSAIRSSVEGLLAENRTLGAIRDAMLPQLMSGKLRVRDAEDAVAKVL